MDADLDADDPRFWRRAARRRRTCPPARPAAFAPGELRFTPQPAVRWFSPGVLTALGPARGRDVGVRVVPRQARAPVGPGPARPTCATRRWTSCGSTTWPTPATASRRRPRWRRWSGAGAGGAEGGDRPLPRGDILVFGGDEVYPAASTEGYEDRLEGPWRAALPWTAPRPPVALRHPRQPRLVRRADRVPAAVRPGSLDRRLAHPPDPQLLRGRAAPRLVAVGHRHPVGRPDRRAPARLLRPGGRRSADARRPADAGHGGADLDRARPGPAGLPQPRLPGAARAATRRHRAEADGGRRPPPLLPLRTTAAPRTEIGPTHKITAGGGGAFLHPTHVLPDRRRPSASTRTTRTT